MKRMIVVPLALMFLGSGAFASPLCSTGTLDTYITSYSGFANACIIGDKLFYNFGYTASLNTGAAPVAAEVAIAPDPGDGVTNPGMLFSVGGFLAFPGDILDATITYNVATLSGSALMQGYSLSIAGSHTAQPLGGAFGTVTESFSNSPLGTPLVTSVGPLSGNVLSASALFTPYVSGTTVTTAIHLQAPNSPSRDTVTISAIQEHFNEAVAPEPYQTVMIGSGLLLFGLSRRRKSK